MVPSEKTTRVQRQDLFIAALSRDDTTTPLLLSSASFVGAATEEERRRERSRRTPKVFARKKYIQRRSEKETSWKQALTRNVKAMATVLLSRLL